MKDEDYFSKPPKGRPKSKGRFEMLNMFVDSTMRTLKPNDAKLWLALFRETKPNGFAQISKSQLATLAGVSIDTVKRGINRLMKSGLLKVIRKGSNLTGESNVYRIEGG